MATQPTGGWVEPHGVTGGLPSKSTKGDPAWDALHDRMDELLAMSTLKRSEFGRQSGTPKASLSRYFNRGPGGEIRLCPWNFMEKLMMAAQKGREQDEAGVLAEAYRLDTLKRHHAVEVLVYPNRDLTQITDVRARLEQATAQLSAAYLEIRKLERENERLRREKAPTAHIEQQLHIRRLEAEKWRGVRQALRAEAATLDEQAPSDQWILREPGPQPAPGPQPSWWPKDDAAHPGYPATARNPRTRLALTAGVMALAVTAAVITTLALSNHSADTPLADQPATSTTTATTVVTNPPTTMPSSPDTQASASDAAHVTVKYTDTSITMPGVTSTDCQAAGINFDTPLGSGDVGFALMEASLDLYSVGPCPEQGNGPLINSLRQWGTAPAQQPQAAQCLQDAETRTLPGTIKASAFTVGSAYCLITGESNLAWFTVTANDNGSYTVNATLWTED